MKTKPSKRVSYEDSVSNTSLGTFLLINYPEVIKDES